MNIHDRFNSLTHYGASWVLWLLIALSVLGVAIILERGYFFATSREDVSALVLEVRELLLIGDVESARRRLAQSRGVEARVAMAGLDADGREVATERIAGARVEARATMERNVAFLGTLGNNAPFVGLLGTIIGIVRAFHELDRGAGQVSAGLMAEIGEALLATAMGLMVALPAVAAFNLFQRLIRSRLARADRLAREITAYHAASETTEASPANEV